MDKLSLRRCSGRTELAVITVWSRDELFDSAEYAAALSALLAMTLESVVTSWTVEFNSRSSDLQNDKYALIAEGGR